MEDSKKIQLLEQELNQKDYWKKVNSWTGIACSSIILIILFYGLLVYLLSNNLITLIQINILNGLLYIFDIIFFVVIIYLLNGVVYPGEEDY